MRAPCRGCGGCARSLGAGSGTAVRADAGRPCPGLRWVQPAPRGSVPLTRSLGAVPGLGPAARRAWGLLVRERCAVRPLRVGRSVDTKSAHRAKTCWRGRSWGTRGLPPAAPSLVHCWGLRMVHHGAGKDGAPLAPIWPGEEQMAKAGAKQRPFPGTPRPLGQHIRLHGAFGRLEQGGKCVRRGRSVP